jgi:hypothetical protein
MATLTVTDDRLRQIDEFAKEEAISREDAVNEAIDAYLRQKPLPQYPSEWGRKMARLGFTEDEVMEIINYEIRLARAERKDSASGRSWGIRKKLFSKY